MEEYLRIVKKVLKDGLRKENRTGIPTQTIIGEMFEHSMAEGFPLLTTKQVSFNRVASELEFFVKGFTDKRWLQERNNHIWDAWCNPTKVPYGNDDETKRCMREERDLGPIYGFQWRHFGATYAGPNVNYTGQGKDQLQEIMSTLKRDPNNRRMIVSAWNPLDLEQMALPPCHFEFQVGVLQDKLNLTWAQRSVDVMLGLPYNIASYALLLHLLCNETGLKEGKLIGFLTDVQIYENHLTAAQEQLKREPLPLPHVVTEHFSSLFQWQYTDSKLRNYRSHPAIKMEVAV